MVVVTPIMESQRPSARAAVKAGEAAREADCLDGEHADGNATMASEQPVCAGQRTSPLDARPAVAP
jgi:hypothetical protein